jgi:hypothetical protein
MVHLECRNETVPQIQPKYNQKLDIKEEKAKDIYSMRNYCNILTESELDTGIHFQTKINMKI